VKKILAAALALLSAMTAFPQEGVHVIASLEFQITGMTSEAAIRSHTDLREGQEFPSAEALTTFLDRQRQDLINARVFDSVEFSDTVISAQEGRTEHAVVYAIADSFTVFPLPYPSYDSNSGLQLGVETRYDNAFGTMTNWYLDIYVVLRGRDGGYGMGPWKIHPRIGNIRAGGLTWSVDVNQEHRETRIFDTLVSTTIPQADFDSDYTSIDLSTGFSLGGMWSYGVNLGASATYNYTDRGSPAGFARDYFGISLHNGLGVGRIDWIGNFRKGASAGIEHTISGLDRNNAFGITNEIGLNGSWYLPFLFFDYYGRARAQVDFNNEPGSLGSWLRGIQDSTLGGVAGIFLNQTLGIDVVHWKGVFDIQLHPFIDAGLVIPASRAFNAASDIRAGAGADLLLFIDAISNFTIHVTFGLDLTAVDPLGNPEIIFNTSVFY
jgi:hypothetical protein